MSARDDYPYWPAPADRRFSAEGSWHWSIAMDEIDRLRSICDAAHTLVREDSYTVTSWQALVNALADANYEPRP